jgi:hypothetical protein
MTTHNELFNRTRAAFQQCFPLLSVTPEQIGTFIQCQMDSGVLPPSKVAHVRCKRCESELIGPELFGFCKDETCPYSDIMQAVDADRCFETSLVPSHWKRYPITMTARSDDGVVEIELDASPYFYQDGIRQNLPAAIQLLSNESFNGGDNCDHVLYYMERWNSDAARLIAHCVHMASVGEGEHHVGFQVRFLEPEQFDALQLGLAHYQSSSEER